MSKKKTKLPNVKEEATEDLARYESKLRKGSVELSRTALAESSESKSIGRPEAKNVPFVRSVQKQSLALESKLESKRKAKKKSGEVLQVVEDQAMEINKSVNIPMAIQRQSRSLDYSSNIPPSVMSQSMNLDYSSNILEPVMSQSMNLDYSSNILEPVMSQSMDLDSSSFAVLPPPPPLPDVPAYPAHPPISQSQPQRFKINPKDLVIERKKLKKPEEITKQVNIERDDFFDVHKKYDYMPMLDARETLRMSTLRTEVVSISFDGIEQLTDAFLFSLHHCKLSLDSVKWTSFTGCYNITDEGVYWVSLAFPNMRSIQLTGCSRVTEKSIHYLSKLKMQTISVGGTNCGVVPPTVHVVGGEGFPKVTLDGCPLVSPLVTEIDRTGPHKSWIRGNYIVPYRKVVILSPEDLPWNTLALLTGEKDVTPKIGLTFKQDWSPFKDHDITGVKSSAQKFNVFQISHQKGLNELVLSPGSIVILPYHMHKDMGANPAMELASTINCIISKYDDCSFVTLAMSSDSDNTDYQPTVDKMDENVKKYLSRWNERLAAAIRTSLHTNWRMAAFNFQEQESLSAGQRFLRQMSSFFEQDISTLVSSHISVKGNHKISSKDLKFLSTIVEADEHYFPWNRHSLLSNKILEYSEKLKKSELPLTSASDARKLCKFNDLPERTYTSHMSKLMKFSALWGKCLFYPELPAVPFVTNFQFLADIIQTIFLSSAPRTCDIRCFGIKIPCWTRQDLLNVWHGATQEQSLLLIDLLEKLGCLMTFALDEWAEIQDVSYVYVLYKDFPKKPPLLLEEYWPLNRGKDVVERTKLYFSSPGLPDSFFPNLLRNVFKLGGPVLTWKDGAVIEKGPLSILVEKIQEFQGLPVVVIQVRGSAISEMTYSEEDWTTLKLYTNVMDHLILEYKLSCAKTVPCINCPQATEMSRYQILKAKRPGRFFHEHLVRTGENRDVKCKQCHEPCNSAQQLGPAINLTDLVPHHDRNGIALGTTNFFNRCLMCENCAVDGIKCDVNLKQGIRNWHCGCEREGMLCNYCGMCQRCFIFIKDTVSTVEPVFIPPQTGRYERHQLVASDEVNITERGSILGLLSETMEKSLKSSIMTPNYCPVVALTVIQNGHFWLNLATPAMLLKYSSETGKVLENQRELLAGTSYSTCHSGDTMKIMLSYVEGSFKMMYLCLVLNDTEIYRTKMKAGEVTLTVCSGSIFGVHLQIETPKKFLRTLNFEKGEKKNCGQAVMNLPCSLEMRMYGILEGMEQICFGGRGISMTGSACITLPVKMSLQYLKYPRKNLLDDVNFHHLCLTWNPTSGRNVLGRKNKSDVSYADRINYDTWLLRKLVHFVDAEGLHQSNLENIRELGSVIWMWHFIMSTYPEMILPETTSKLLHGDILTYKTQVQVKEGLRSLVRRGMWKYYALTDLDAIETLVKPNTQGQHFLTTKSELVQGSLVLQELLQNNIESTGLKQISSKFNKSLALYLCESHVDCMRSKESLTEIVPELMGGYSEFLTFIDISFNDIKVIPDKFFARLPNLIDLKIAHNFLEKIPGSIKLCKKLLSLVAMENNLSDLPVEISELKNLQGLDIGNNCFSKIPDAVTKLTELTKLAFPYMMLTEMPEDIGNLVNLRFLQIHGNCFSRLPKSFEKLVNLEELHLTGVVGARIGSSQDHMSYAEFNSYMHRRLDRWLRANGESKKKLFHMFDENDNGVLDIKEIGKLNATVFSLFPRFGYKGKEHPDESTPHGFPMEILKCKKLKVLVFQYQGFTKIPPEICQLENLLDLSIGHNPNLLSIPAEISQIKTLKKIDIDDCPLLKTPPREIREKGFHSVFAYLQRLMSGAVLSKRTKLMMVGLGGAGKTSLVKAFLSKDGKANLKQGEAITDGIDINTWEVEHESENITYNIWDFAGQTVYYNTHQFFLSSNRAIYMLLWNVRLGHEHAGLDFWLSSISVQAPDAPIFVIGSHVDQVSKSELPIEEMQQRYPQVIGFHFVSSFTGEGIQELKKKLFEVTLQQQYMGEYIPGVWLTFEKNIEQIKEKNDIVTYNSITLLANKSGIFEPSEIYQAVQFLHDIGSVQHFSNEYLKSQVVINPQWIVDVMACVVSVKSDVIKNGRLLHEDIDKVWSDYPKNLRGWLLRLTEEFDLTFQLKDQQVNVVPCLLPEKKPKFVWPEIEKGSDIRENEMVYTFDYLPAGLFNRAQVRLHSLSDNSLIWKKGSFLIKNVHVALLQHVKESVMIVTAQGPRPENILFLIHEVFECLIAESFHGVTYDFTMPCPECQRMGVKDRHMFGASTIKRALEMKAPFLQCIKYFHTVSLATLRMLLPPDNHSDFDAHLVHCVQGLKNLKKDLAADIFISFCGKDDLLEKSSYIVPSRVHTDLVNKGYKCWYKDKDSTESTDEMAKALIDSSVFLAFVSVNYADDVDCVNIFKYARLTLKKNIVVVAIGDGFEWKQSKLGILLVDEVFVNMIKVKYQHYDLKFEELIKTLKGKSESTLLTNPTVKPDVFFSYSWVNSEQAVKLGTREIPGALGYGDPRELKTFLEESGYRCWIDVERIGMNGLFDDIAEGLLSAKVVIVCVSDEYAMSQACLIEFRYAANTLKLPVIMAVVGTGDKWRAMEIGLMSVNFPIVNFQEKTENARKKLLNLVKERLDLTQSTETSKAQKNKSNEEHKNLSYQELFELGQRRLLRQLTVYTENQDLDVYPRVFVVDFVRDEDADKLDPDKDVDKKEKAEKADIGREKSFLSPEGTSAKRFLSKKSSVMLPAFRLQKYCVYTLCEHDEGWHSVAEPINLSADFGVTDLDMYSPYLSRMTTVMKFNKKLAMNCLTDDVGEAYIDWLEKSAEAMMSDYQAVYHSFREMMFNLDEDQKRGNLSRCHLSNGKTIWLCDKHRDSMRVTCLSEDEKTTHSTKDSEDKVTNWMLTELRAMDLSLEFKSIGNAPRALEQLNKFTPDKKKKRRDKSQSRKRGGTKKPGNDGDDETDATGPGTNEAEDEDDILEREENNEANENEDKKTFQDNTKEVTGTAVVKETNKDIGSVPHQPQTDDTASVVSNTSQVSTASASNSRQQQRRPLPGQSQYKVPTYSQKSRACVLS